MTRAFAICMFLLTASCGGEELELGGVRRDGGSPATRSSSIVTLQRNASSLHSEGSYLYWTTHDGTSGDRASEILRCHKDDCAGTRQILFQTRDAGRLVVRSGRAYFRHNEGIVACAVDDCATPRVIIARASGAPSIVDDLNVYWWSTQDNALLSCPLAGCDEATVAVPRVGEIIDAAVDDAHIFWTMWESVATQGIRSSPKYGTPPTSGNEVTLQPRIGAFALDDAFAYWSQNLAFGTVNRTRKIKPHLLEPHTQVLAAGQHFPHALAIDYDVLFWMNEVLPEEELGKAERPVRIVSCILPSCATSIEVLDEAAGGSLVNPINYLGSGMMVLDAEAIYYIGDVASVGSTRNVMDASIRRLPRRPDR